MSNIYYIFNSFSDQNSSIQVTVTPQSLPYVHIYQLNDDEGEEERSAINQLVLTIMDLTTEVSFLGHYLDLLTLVIG